MVTLGLVLAAAAIGLYVGRRTTWPTFFRPSAATVAAWQKTP